MEQRDAEALYIYMLMSYLCEVLSDNLTSNLKT